MKTENDQQNHDLHDAIDLNDINPNSIPDKNIESNARFIQWSDGKFSLAIGDELFDVNYEDLPNSGVFLK